MCREAFHVGRRRANSLSGAPLYTPPCRVNALLQELVSELPTIEYGGGTVSDSPVPHFLYRRDTGREIGRHRVKAGRVVAASGSNNSTVTGQGKTCWGCRFLVPGTRSTRRLIWVSVA